MAKGHIAQAILAAILALTTSARADTTLRVVDWNIGVNGTGTDGKTDANRIYDTLRARAADADVIVCNECYAGTVQSFATKLTTATGRTWTAVTAFDAGSHNHSGILTRYPLASTPKLFSYSQPATMDIGPKTAGRIDIDVDGRVVHLIVTRLCWPCGATVRNVQAQELRAWTQAIPEPKLVFGDFNDNPGAASITTMSTAFIDLYRRAQRDGQTATYPDNTSGRTHGCSIFDYAWLSNQAAGLRLLSAEVPDVRAAPLMNPNPAVTEKTGCTDDYGVRPSDHNLLKVSLNIETGVTPCDVNFDGATDVTDVQRSALEAIGLAACGADVNRDSACNIVDVQRIVAAALAGACVSP